MKNKVLLLIFLAIGAFLRFYQLPNRVPFEWDQERDLQVVHEMVESKRPTLIGPVVRGEGGFMLGPLYTYLLIPGYLVSGGHPLSSPVTNIFIDLAVGICLFFLSRFTGIIWLLSPLVISQSLIAWNVGLIPLWSLLVILLYHKYRASFDKLLPLFSLMAGITWHIHASIIPISAVMLLYLFSSNFRKLNVKIIVLSIVAYLLPLAPLIIFDLRHDFINFNLLLKFFASAPTDKPEAWGFVILEVFKKFVLYLSNVFGSRDNFLVGAISLLMGLFNFRKVGRDKLFYFGLITALSIFFLITYRNPFFPSYYFAPLLLPFIYLLGASLEKLKKHSIIILIIIIWQLLYIGYVNLTKTIPYSLATKTLVVNKLASLPQPIDIRYELSPGRYNGFPYLFNRESVVDDESGRVHAVLKDSATAPSSIDNKGPTEVVFIGPFQLEIYDDLGVK